MYGQHFQSGLLPFLHSSPRPERHHSEPARQPNTCHSEPAAFWRVRNLLFLRHRTTLSSRIVLVPRSGSVATLVYPVRACPEAFLRGLRSLRVRVLTSTASCRNHNHSKTLSNKQALTTLS